MKRLHLIIGITVIVIFILTGQYLEYVHNRILPDGTRMLYRSRHIYLLLSGLLNLILGIYFVPQPRGWRRTVQIAGTNTNRFVTGNIAGRVLLRPAARPGPGVGGSIRDIQHCAGLAIPHVRN